MSQNWKIMVEIIRTTANIGKQGEVKEVSLTFAENKLFPEGIAKIHKAQPSKEEKRLQIFAKRFDIAKRIHEKTMRLNVPNSHGHIDTPIDSEWITKKIRDEFHVSLLPEMVRIDEKSIKKTGKYTVHVDLATDAYAQFQLVLN